MCRGPLQVLLMCMIAAPFTASRGVAQQVDRVDAPGDAAPQDEVTPLVEQALTELTPEESSARKANER